MDEAQREGFANKNHEQEHEMAREVGGSVGGLPGVQLGGELRGMFQRSVARNQHLLEQGRFFFANTSARDINDLNPLTPVKIDSGRRKFSHTRNAARAPWSESGLILRSSAMRR